MTQSNNTHRSPISEIAIAPGVMACATSRGDVVNSPYGSFNICHYTGDSPEHIDQCRRQLRDTTGIQTIIVPRQTHSSCCRWIDSITVSADDLEGVDALVTSLENVMIGVNTADCVPVLLCDTNARIIAAAHAGWRGAVGGILESTLQCMLAHGASLSNILALTAPAICCNCFEVGEEVAAHFPEEVIDRTHAKPHVDLPRYVALRLQNAGINPNHITLSPHCTRCTPDRYFSARALGINSGRNFTAIALKLNE